MVVAEFHSVKDTIVNEDLLQLRRANGVSLHTLTYPLLRLLSLPESGDIVTNEVDGIYKIVAPPSDSTPEDRALSQAGGIRGGVMKFLRHWPILWAHRKTADKLGTSNSMSADTNAAYATGP